MRWTEHHHDVEADSDLLTALVLATAVLVAAGYLRAALVPRSGSWPALCTVAFLLGVAIAAGTVLVVLEHPVLAYPLHMTAHLLSGMVAPILLAAGAPVTLMLRSLHRDAARRLARLLRLRAVAVVSHPITAGVLDIGGLWLLYTTGLYRASHEVLVVLVVVQLHLILAGYLFAAAILRVDPAPHGSGYGMRAAVLVAAFAAHGILAKHLVEHPPAGVDRIDAEIGSMVMYYGGDLVEIGLLVTLGARWYASVRPGRSGPRRRESDAALT